MCSEFSGGAPDDLKDGALGEEFHPDYGFNLHAPVPA